ncbi:glycosyltransferase [Candidatus Sumerlaeota bacterium]|nr:glycosyltransferase [Candidatus Sumerlaeota bacterium]MBI3736675.1 glycosyltransferase [Candidatus Sumerlaeota bacterium]
MSRPRIVHVYKDVYPPVEGGIERTIYHLTRLTKGEFEPSVITAARGMTLVNRRIDEDIEVQEIPSLGRLLSTPLAPGFIGALHRAALDGADLFHFHFPHPTGELAYLCQSLKTPAVATYHSDVVRQRAALLLYRPFMNRFLGRMKVIMPTSKRYLESSQILARHSGRCRIVPLGLPPQDYEPTAATRAMSADFRARFGEFIFFIGVLRYYKGLHLLLKAMQSLPSAKLVIAGEGPEASDLRRVAATLGERVRFMGRVDHPTAVSLFHAAAVFCLPATLRAEAFGLCQIEAMLCGLPVVSTDLPTGVPEINRHGETGLIVPPGDAAALAAALGELLSNPGLRERLGAAARARAIEQYTADKMANRVMAIYREVLHGGSRSGDC